MSAIQADYRTNKHIPSRKCYQLILEVPEEDFPNVCSVLGYPRTGENVYVGIALLDKSIVTKPEINCDKTEGEKLRTRAVMLCKERDFQIFLESLDKNMVIFDEDHARDFICKYCNIYSRSELATKIAAQENFKELLEKYKDWQFENTYADNLNR